MTTQLLPTKTGAATSNAIFALPTEGPFFADLSLAVSNSGDVESAGSWLLGFVSRYLESRGLLHGPIAAFDFVWPDIEALDRFWPMMSFAEVCYREQGLLAALESPLPQLARFLVERMPSIWDGGSWSYHQPVTRAVVLADRADTLVGLFAAGLKPSGSKDPFALRRAARHLLMGIMFPITRSKAQ